MSKLEFVRKLYNGKNCYSDHMSEDEINFIHLESGIEGVISEMLDKNKIIFLTGNPGDGKTFVIKTLKEKITQKGVYVETDLNNIRDYSEVVENLVRCYTSHTPALIAVNEYPFIQLCKELRKENIKIYDEIQESKRTAITYGTSQPLLKQIAVVDLNERNLIGKDYVLMPRLIERMIELLKEDEITDKCLKRNLKALGDSGVWNQLSSIIQLAAAECEHFAARDVIGAVSFMLTACTSEDYSGMPYYEAIFEGTNSLLKAMQQFDPVYLTNPELDEKLWNGDVKDGWVIDSPESSPKDYEDIEEAVDCFKKIKRQYYFENMNAGTLLFLQPDEIMDTLDKFTNFASKRKQIKEGIIRALNKLFLPSSDEKRQLRIWTTHKYDMSQDAAVAVSSRSIDSSELELFMPRPSDWLKGMEYYPDHMILKPKRTDLENPPELVMDIDFLRTLDAIEKGYPVGLLAPQYEQAAAMFLQQLQDNDLSELNEEGEILIASRKQSYKMSVYIQDGKYSFEEED